MKTTHTPGPWERKSIPGHLFEIHDKAGDPVFRIRGGMNPTLADARLIAAAPELLKVVEGFAAWEAPDSPMSDDELRELFQQARDAIAKAKGA